MMLLQHLTTYRSNSEFVFLTLEKEKRGTLKNYHLCVSGEMEEKNPNQTINGYQHIVFFFFSQKYNATKSFRFPDTLSLVLKDTNFGVLLCKLPASHGVSPAFLIFSSDILLLYFFKCFINRITMLTFYKLLHARYI